MAGNKSKKRKQVAAGPRETSAALPLSFGMSLEQAARLKRIPQDSLHKFQEKTAVKLDSTNIYLRLCTGLYICLQVLKMEADLASIYEPIREAIETVRMLMYRNEELPQTEWRMSPGEYEIILEAFDIIDQLQDQVTRRELLLSYREAQKSIEQAFRKAYPGRAVPKETYQQIVTDRKEEDSVRIIGST